LSEQNIRQQQAAVEQETFRKEDKAETQKIVESPIESVQKLPTKPSIVNRLTPRPFITPTQKSGPKEQSRKPAQIAFTEHKPDFVTQVVPKPSLKSVSPEIVRAHEAVNGVPESQLEAAGSEASFAFENDEARSVSLEAEAIDFATELGLASDETEDDSWIDTLIIPGIMSEAENQEAVTPEALSESRTIVLTKIAEVIAPPESVAEKTEVLLSHLPEVVQISLAEFVQESEPEVAEAVSELVVQMALATNRLQVLIMTDRAESEEAAQIEIVLEEWYDTLLTYLEIEDAEAKVAEFIRLVRSGNYVVLQQPMPENTDEGTHERKFNVPLTQGLSRIMQQVQTAIGKLAVGQAVYL